MLDGNNSHLRLAVLFLYIASGIYSCDFLKSFNISIFWSSVFKTVIIVNSRKKNPSQIDGYLYMQSLQNIENWLKCSI